MSFNLYDDVDREAYSDYLDERPPREDPDPSEYMDDDEALSREMDAAEHQDQIDFLMGIFPSAAYDDIAPDDYPF